jgi:hypothetical protein
MSENPERDQHNDEEGDLFEDIRSFLNAQAGDEIYEDIRAAYQGAQGFVNRELRPMEEYNRMLRALEMLLEEEFSGMLNPHLRGRMAEVLYTYGLAHYSLLQHPAGSEESEPDSSEGEDEEAGGSRPLVIYDLWFPQDIAIERAQDGYYMHLSDGRIDLTLYLGTSANERSALVDLVDHWGFWARGGGAVRPPRRPPAPRGAGGGPPAAGGGRAGWGGGARPPPPPPPRPGQGEPQRRSHRQRPPARGVRREAHHHAGARARAHRWPIRPADHVRGRRHGQRHHRRTARLTAMAYLLLIPVVLVAVVVGINYGWTWVLAPLLGLVVARFLLGSLRALLTDARTLEAHEGAEPTPVTADERTLFWCEECGTELLLLVRGTSKPPSHCAQRMHQRTEIAN